MIWTEFLLQTGVHQSQCRGEAYVMVPRDISQASHTASASADMLAKVAKITSALSYLKTWMSKVNLLEPLAAPELDRVVINLTTA